MTETQLSDVLRALSDGLRKRGIKAVLFGGFALPLYGVERVTLDLDFLLCDEDIDGFRECLVGVGYREVLRTPQYAKFRHSAEAALDVDTVFVESFSMERIWQTSRDHALGGNVLRCASLDTMLGTKLHAIKYNESVRGRRDLDDVVQLLSANGIDPRADRFQCLCEKYGTQAILERICSELGENRAS